MNRTIPDAVVTGRRRKAEILGAVTLVITWVGGAMCAVPEPVAGAEPPAGRAGLGIPVQVVNDDDEPVPVSGTVEVSNLPAVQSVEVSGTPTVHVASMPPVVVDGGESPFQWAGVVDLPAGDFGSDCIELLPSDLPAGKALVVEQIAAVARINDLAAEAQYFVEIPAPTPENPDESVFIQRQFPDLQGQALVLEEKAVLGGPGGASRIRACVIGPEISMHFRLFGHLVSVNPPPS